MKKILFLFFAATLVIAASPPFPVPPKPLRGKANAACRADEPGPAVRVDIAGLKDRSGKVRLELYPATDADFLAPDKVLIAAGKVFKRVEINVPASGNVEMCIRAPTAGRYALAVLHDRDGDGKFGFLRDGAGASNNPKARLGKPRASEAAMTVGAGVSRIRIILNYRKGLGYGPLIKE